MNKEQWLTKTGEIILAEYAKKGLVLGNETNIYFRTMPPIFMKNTLGWCIFQGNTFFVYVKDIISNDFFRDKYDILHTLVHEICHVLDKNINNSINHGKTWKKLMRVFGANDAAKTESNAIHSQEFFSWANKLFENLPSYNFKDYFLENTEKPKNKQTFFKRKFATQFELFDFIEKHEHEIEINELTLNFKHKNIKK